MQETAPQRCERCSDPGIETMRERQRPPQALVDLEGLQFVESLDQGLECEGKSRTREEGSRSREMRSVPLGSIRSPGEVAKLRARQIPR
jgi:hypothetical protein